MKRAFIILTAGLMIFAAGCSADVKGSAGASSASQTKSSAANTSPAATQTLVATQTASATEINNQTQEPTMTQSPTENPATPTPIVWRTYEDNPATYPVVTIEMQSGKKIVIELYPHIAPNTVENFISLINKGFYNGLSFHRAVPGFVLQGGDPNGNGTGGPGYYIKGEFTANNFTNNLSHTTGVISMARGGQYNTAGSQFFIAVANQTSLDGKYAAFGKVTTGMDVVNEIVNTPTTDSKPITPQIMKTVTVDTKGVTYPDPITTPR